jgi:hypothetical protein
VSNLSEFDHVMLDDTFVLEWCVSPAEVVFHVLAHLRPEHPQASSPAPGDWACYRPANIVFPNVAECSGLLPKSEVASTIDPDGSIDYGTIDALLEPNAGTFRICGNFGDVLIRSDSPRLDIESVA